MLQDFLTPIVHQQQILIQGVIVVIAPILVTTPTETLTYRVASGDICTKSAFMVDRLYVLKMQCRPITKSSSITAPAVKTEPYLTFTEGNIMAEGCTAVANCTWYRSALRLRLRLEPIETIKWHSINASYALGLVHRPKLLT